MIYSKFVFCGGATSADCVLFPLYSNNRIVSRRSGELLLKITAQLARDKMSPFFACVSFSAPSWVGEWSEEEGLKTLYKNDGDEFCSSTTLARDVGRGVSIVTALYDRGILVAKG
jgi:hypothetical protein